MAVLVEDVVSLEKEANAIVAQARAEATELEKLAIAEAEAYRRKLIIGIKNP
jgi:vacuolar-type H+-ATPase subunit H